MASNPGDSRVSQQPSVSSFSNFPAKLICIFVFFLWAFVLVRKYINFGYDDWDLAFFNHATANLLRGDFYNSIFDVKFFGNHSNLIAYLILPIYALAPYPLTLVFLKVLSLIGGGYIFYKITLDKLGEKVSLCLLLLYLFYPLNIFGILYDFDYESLSPIFIFAMYYFFKKDKFIPFFITALLMITIKENMPLIVLAFGIQSFFIKKEKIKWGALTVAVAMGAFYVLTSVFIPFFREDQTHGYVIFYSQFGNSPVQIISNILLHPQMIIPFIFEPMNLRLMFHWFSPVLFLNLPGLGSMFLALPLMLQHLLTRSQTTHSIYFQYGISLAPFIFLGLNQTLTLIFRHMRSMTKIIILCLIILMYIFTMKEHWPAFLQRAAIHPNSLSPYQWQLIKKIPKNEPTIATLSFLSELSNRSQIYAFHKVYFDGYQQGPKPFKTPLFVNYALIDFNNPWLLAEYDFNPKRTNKYIRRFYEDRNWGLVSGVQETVLLKRDEPFKLIEKTSLRQTNQNSQITIDSKFSLNSFEILQKGTQEGSIWPLKFTWQSLGKIKDTYDVIICFLKDGQPMHCQRREIGYKIYPTFTWNKDETIVERYNLLVPKLEKGSYILGAYFVNKTQNPEALIKVEFAEQKKSNLFLGLTQFKLDQ
jgi:uncharacterized membrane protein